MMLCTRNCKFYHHEYDMWGFRGYICYITNKLAHSDKQECSFWDKTIKEINDIK